MAETPGKSAYCIEYFYAKPQYREALIKALSALIAPTRAEPGCLQYDLLVDKENPNLLILLVKFHSEEAMKKHEQQPYVKEFAEKYLHQYCEKFLWDDAFEVNLSFI